MVNKPSMLGRIDVCTQISEHIRGLNCLQIRAEIFVDMPYEFSHSQERAIPFGNRFYLAQPQSYVNDIREDVDNGTQSLSRRDSMSLGHQQSFSEGFSFVRI